MWVVGLIPQRTCDTFGQHHGSEFGVGSKPSGAGSDPNFTGLAGGLGKVHQLFGAEQPKVIEEWNRELAA